MKTKINIILMSVIMITCLFTACTNTPLPPEDPIAISIVVGRHANANEFSEECYERVTDIIRKAVYGGHISVIISDGEPRSVDLVDSNKRPISFAADANNKQTKEDRINKRCKDVMSFIRNDELRANAPENDLLKAIKEARAALNKANLTNISKKYIIIMDTGISTEGEFKFQDLNLDSPESAPTPETIVKELQKNEGTLPDLSGINIQFIGLGDVAEPQIMSDTNKIYVKNIWKSIFKACKAEIADDSILIAGLGDDIGISTGKRPNEILGDNNSGGNYPMVTPIRFTPIKNNFDDEKIPTDALGFKPNKAEYLSKDTALYILKPYAEGIKAYLKENPSKKIYLIGTVAITKEGDSGDFNLSKKRAEAVKKTLVEDYELPKDRLITIGLGGIAPWREKEFVEGKFDHNLAQFNRSVWILNENSEKYKSIPEEYKTK